MVRNNKTKLRRERRDDDNKVMTEQKVHEIVTEEFSSSDGLT